MSIYITQRPAREFTNPSFLSKWNCSGEENMHMMYYFQRRDIEIIGVVPGTGDITVELPDNALSVSILVGDVLYLSALSYDTAGEVTAITGGGGSNVFVTLAIADMLNPTSGYVNLISARANYYLEVTIMGWNSSPSVNHTSGDFEVYATVQLFPDQRGNIKFDVRHFVNKHVTHPLVLDDSKRNAIDKSQGSFFYLEHLETWNGSSEAIVIDGGGTPNLCYFIPAVKQLGEAYGNNLAEYVPFDDASVATKARFLTDFDKPTFFVGFPFRIHFIYSEIIAGYDVTLEQDKINNAGAVSGHVSTHLVTSQAVGVNQLAPIGCLSTDTGGSSIPSGTTALDVWLKIQGQDPNDYVQAGYWESGYAESVIIPGSITPYIITEVQRIKVKENVCGIQLWWKGSKCNWNQWVFETKTVNESSSSNEGVRGIYNESVEDALAVVETLKKKSKSTVTLFTRILQEDLSGMLTLLDTVSLLMYYPITGKFISLQQSSAKIKYTNTQSTIAITLTLEFPEGNTVNR